MSSPIVESKRIPTCHVAWVTGIYLSLCIASASSYASDHTILVDNDSSVELQLSASAVLTGFRSIVAPSFTTGEKGDFNFPRGLIVDAALAFPEVKAKILVGGYRPNNISLEVLKNIILDSGYSEKCLYNETEEDSLVGSSYIMAIPTEYYPDQEIHFFSPVSVMNPFSTDVIDIDKVNNIWVEGNVISYYAVSDVYEDELNFLYQALSRAKHYESRDLQIDLIGLRNSIREYDALERSLLYKLGEISFGMPLVQTAREMALIVPGSIASRFDVYWVELAITFRCFDAGELEEMSFNVGLPADHVALELIPLRYGPQIETQVDTRSPEIGARVGGVNVTIGEFFRKTVGYSHIKPTVTAAGLREDRFSWTLRDEAIALGSHKFIVVIGVQRGADAVELSMSAHVKTDPSLFFAGNVAGTDVKVINVRLR